MSEEGADRVEIFSDYNDDFYADFLQIYADFIGAFWQKLTIFLSFFQSVSEEGADRVEIFSDDDDDFSSPEEGSDSEPMLDDQVSTRR